MLANIIIGIVIAAIFILCLVKIITGIKKGGCGGCSGCSGSCSSCGQNCHADQNGQKGK